MNFFDAGHLANVSVEDTQQPGKLQLLPAFDRQLLDLITSLEQDFELILDPSILLSAQLFL